MTNAAGLFTVTITAFDSKANAYTGARRAVTYSTLTEAVVAVTLGRENGDGSDEFAAYHPNGRQVTRGEARTVDVEKFLREEHAKALKRQRTLRNRARYGWVA